MSKYILCFSGGKDSTAMLIHILENGLPLDEILYVDVGDWMWEAISVHLDKIKEKFGVEITTLDVTDELWNRLRKMQWQTDGYYNNGRSIFEYEERCWKKEKDNLERKRMVAREKYNQRGKKNG